MALLAHNDLEELRQSSSSEECQDAPSKAWTSRRVSGALSAMLLVGAITALAGWKGSPALFATRGGIVGLDEQQCFEGGTEELQLKLPAFDDKEVTIPVFPSDNEAYSYAADMALVSIPNGCYKKFKAKITKNTTLVDRGSTEGTAYFYISDLEGGYATLASMKDCACGLVIEMHGSGGPGWTAVQTAAMFSGKGFIQITPNSMAMPEEMGLKSKLPLKDIADIDVSNYCGEYLAFDGSCKKFPDDGPMCYSTKVENILESPDDYRKFVEGVYTIRKRELDSFFDTYPDFVNSFEDVFLFGNSEGAMAASRYHHATLDAKLSGRILSAWSCNFNYFVSCADNALICGDQCDKTVPQLNLIGTKDSYFGAQKGSVSSKIAAAENGYGGDITGNCRATYKKQQFDKSIVVLQDGAYHGPQYSDDNTWRNVIADFINNKGESESDWKSVDAWKSLDACDEKEDGVWTCPADGPSTCKTTNGKYQVNPEATFNPVSTISCSK